MNKYESVIIINPSVDEEAMKALEKKYTDIINNEGKVESVDDMGKKRLAYEIMKNKENSRIYTEPMYESTFHTIKINSKESNIGFVKETELDQLHDKRNIKQGEERQADFINVVAWSKLGEFCSKYFKKGQQVGVIGRLQVRNWDDEQGQKHYITEVVAEEAYFADSKRDGANDAMNFENTFGENVASSSPEFEVTSDDDLPF